MGEEFILAYSLRVCLDLEVGVGWEDEAAGHVVSIVGGAERNEHRCIAHFLLLCSDWDLSPLNYDAHT